MHNIATMIARMMIGLSGLVLIVTPTQSHAEGLGGSFSGQVTQDNPPQTYPMEMNLYGAVGNINYPTLRCGGNLVFINTDGTSFWYREHITYGADHCIEGGTIQLRRHSLGGDTNWDWHWTGGGANVRGVVTGGGVAER